MFAEVAEKGPLKIFIKSIRTIEKKKHNQLFENS